MRCIPETMQGVGSQRNRKENQDTLIQDFLLVENTLCRLGPMVKPKASHDKSLPW